MADEFKADTADLGAFGDRGRSHLTEIEAIQAGLVSKRSLVGSTLGDGPLGDVVDGAVDVLRDRTFVANVFVETIRDALVACETDDDPSVAVQAGLIDVALAEVGLSTNGSFTAGRAGRLADRLDPGGLAEDGAVATIGEAYRTMVSEIDEGDDLGISNGELNRVRSELADLDDDGVRLVFAELTDQQLQRLLHNVHSSGFWSNDWDDRERTEFYRLLEPLSAEAKIDAGRFSPFLEAWGEAEAATDGDGTATAALGDLVGADSFEQELDYDERTAVLWQAAHHPEPEAITNLERLTAHSWFRGSDLEDVQRSAKLVAHLSGYWGGDQTTLHNTLDLFLAPDAPYRFDWEQEGGAYGSASGDEFHFNRDYLDAGNDPVSVSIPAGVDREDTEHMVTHTVAHEVNHLVNGDGVATTYEYFMGEYRAYWVGHVAQNGTAPTRADVEGRVRHLLTASTGAYSRIAAAVDDPVEGPLIAAFVEDVVGRPVTADDMVTEISAGVTAPTVAAPTPVSVDGGPNSLDNGPTGAAR